jgi:hypothetical protein
MERDLQKIDDDGETEPQQTILKYLRIALSSQMRLWETADTLAVLLDCDLACIHTALSEVVYFVTAHTRSGSLSCPNFLKRPTVHILATCAVYGVADE